MTLALLLALAAAQHKPPPKKPPPPPPPEIDLLPPEAKPDPEKAAELERQFALRRTMLRWHQVGGFATVATMTATVVLGQIDYLDKYGGHGDVGRVHLWHRWMGFTTAGVFAATASLAIFAPNPIDKPVQLDHSTMHKLAMSVATAGMVAQIVLGIVTASKEGQLVQRDFALAHQIIGYTTLAATATGFTVLTF